MAELPGPAQALAGRSASAIGSQDGRGAGVEQPIAMEGRLSTGEHIPITVSLQPSGDAWLALDLDARLRETLAQGPVHAELGDTAFTLEGRGHTVFATLQTADGSSTYLQGTSAASGRTELHSAQAGSERSHSEHALPGWLENLLDAGRYALDQTLGFFGGAGKELLDQVKGLWDLTSQTAETVIQATLAPFEWVAGATAGGISSLWRQGGPMELGADAWDREIEATRQAWADIGASGENFIQLIWNLGPGQVFNYSRSLTQLSARLEARALETDDLSRAEIRSEIEQALGENPSYAAVTAIADALTNYRGIVAAAESGDDRRIAEEIGRASVRILDLLAAVVLTGRKAADAADVAADAARRADATPNFPGPKLDDTVGGLPALTPKDGLLGGAGTPVEAATKVRQLNDSGQIKRIGQGDFNTVYATTAGTGADADKILRISRNLEEPSTELARSIMDEARATIAAGRLGIGPDVYVNESFLVPDAGYAALSIQRFGKSLGQIDIQALSAAQRETIATNIAQQVGRAHQHNLVHVDLHPGNILVDSAGEVRLTDFGLSGRATRHRDFTPIEGEGLPGSRIDLDVDFVLHHAESLRPADVSADQWRRQAADAYLDALRGNGYPDAPGPATQGAMEARQAKIERAEQAIEDTLHNMQQRDMLGL